MPLNTLFVGLDNDAIGDGSADETMPIDTYLQNRWQYNIQDLLVGRESVSHSPAITNANDHNTTAGIRPFASKEWHTAYKGWLVVNADQSGFLITLFYQNLVPGGGASLAGEVEIKIKLGGSSEFDLTGGTNLVPTYVGGSPEVGHTTFETRFNRPASRPGVVRVTIWVRNKPNESVSVPTTRAPSTGALIEYTAPFHVFDPGTVGARLFFPNSAGVAPDIDSLECMYLRHNSGGYFPAGSNLELTLIYSENLTGAVSGTQMGAVGSIPAGNTGTFPANATLYMHQCFFVRSVNFQPLYGTKTITIPGSSQLNRARFQPNQEFSSADAFRQAQLVRRANLNWRTAMVGPRGRKGDAGPASDTRAYDFFNYATRWPFVMGDYDDNAIGTTPEEFTHLINDAFYLFSENPELELHCLWLSTQTGASYKRNINLTGGSQKDGNSGGIKQKQEHELSQGAGAAQWDMSIVVQQMVDVAAGLADWDVDPTTFGTYNAPVQIPVWGGEVQLAASAPPPVLRGADSFDQLGKGIAEPPTFWYREGSLYAEDLDAGLLKTTRHRMLLNGMTNVEVNRPFRLKLNMDLNDFTDPLREDLTTSSLDALNQSLRLILVSYCLVEIPVEP